MVGTHPLLILPLMYHLVQQRVKSLIPAISPDMAPADDNFRLASCLATPHIVAQSALHAPRNSDWKAIQLTPKSRLIEKCVVLEKLAHEWLICRVCALRRANLAGTTAYSRLLSWLELEC